ncbi:helix-turn-helix domain-containing protein [Mucilaginibacter roseus]|uniref:Helix-turn-helix domain-containing protein n=1 Tax=Mucilaginibacter roseus TaxID=1528868 RepID=A0ABS8U1B7_9SPHI|nr:helix-turn-helix domain-containing protein [Mucilaginibacter roseus]MCD8739313.1 helix-turn-helix domain-containing protein [Mucilaginibacter roseus]
MDKAFEQRTKAPGSVPTRNQILTIGDMEDFKNDVLQELKQIIKDYISGAPGKKWLKSAEVKKLLGISHGFLQSLRDSGVLPFTKIGGSIYYDYEDITFMMTTNKSVS